MDGGSIHLRIRLFECGHYRGIIQAVRHTTPKRIRSELNERFINPATLIWCCSQANMQGRGSPAPPSYKNCIQLAACGPSQVLPMNPDLPADLFTSCLTTPIKVALRWFVLQSTSKLVPEVTLDLIDKSVWAYCFSYNRIVKKTACFQNTWANIRSAHYAGRIELDIHCHYGHNCLEYFTQRWVVILI